MILRFAFLLPLLGLALAAKSYSGYQVLQTAPLTPNVMPYINKMSRRLDFWGTPLVGRPATIMVSPEEMASFSASLDRLQISHQVLIDDVATVVQKERAEHEALKHAFPRQPRAPVYDRFMEFDEIMDYQHEINMTYPEFVSMVHIGMSSEDRMVHATKISNGAPGQPAVWFECALHAREWISPPVCLRIIEELIADPALRDLADWYILPVANPDGYVYSWSDERLWRKTRRPNPGSTCVGTDPNRNFDFFWDSTGNTCELTYPGPTAFSEPECAGIGNFISSNADSLVLFVTLHSYGQLILYPYGHTSDPAPNVEDLITAGQLSADAIAAVSGTSYSVENTAAGLYYVYGASDDYAYGIEAVLYSYTFELPGGGPNGFDPPASAIQGVIDETWPGLKALVEHVVGLSKK